MRIATYENIWLTVIALLDGDIAAQEDGELAEVAVLPQAFIYKSGKSKDRVFVPCIDDAAFDLIFVQSIQNRIHFSNKRLTAEGKS